MFGGQCRGGVSRLSHMLSCLPRLVLCELTDVGDSCFSTRMMWRANGHGELYLVRLALDLPSRRFISFADLRCAHSTPRSINRPRPSVRLLPCPSAMQSTASRSVAAHGRSPVEDGRRSAKTSGSIHRARTTAGSTSGSTAGSQFTPRTCITGITPTPVSLRSGRTWRRLRTLGAGTRTRSWTRTGCPRRR